MFYHCATPPTQWLHCRTNKVQHRLISLCSWTYHTTLHKSCHTLKEKIVAITKATLTFLLNEQDVDWHKRAPCRLGSVEDVSTDATWDARQRRCDQTERSTSLHNWTRTSWTQHQTMARSQVSCKQRLTPHLLRTDTSPTRPVKVEWQWPSLVKQIWLGLECSVFVYPLNSHFHVCFLSTTYLWYFIQFKRDMVWFLGVSYSGQPVTKSIWQTCFMDRCVLTKSVTLKYS